MAVTLTAEQLAAAIRVGDSPEETAEVERLLAYASEAVTKHAPAAPDVVQNEAVVRLAGYLFDMPQASRGSAYANALRSSGAARLLLPYVIHGAGKTEAVEAAQAAVGTPGNPVVGVAIEAGALTVTFADGSTRTEALPTGGDSIDETARTAAQEAQAAADAAQATADEKQDALMPPSPAEAANGTATTIRGWTAALVRAAIDAVVPADDRLVPAGGATGDILFRQSSGATWTGFRAAVLSVVPQNQGVGVGAMQTATFTSHATAQRYSATGVTPPSSWTLAAVEDRQAEQIYSALQIIDLEYMRSVPTEDRPAAGGEYPAVDAGQGVYALDATGQLLVATFAASVGHTLIYRRLG